MVENGIELRSSGGPESLVRCPSSAAMKVQKAYRSYRTRRMLADSAVVAEAEPWWQAVVFARLNHSTISPFNLVKPERPASRWNCVSLNASKVGKGSTKDAKAQKLAFEHRIEAIDPRHRYGRSLHFYFDEWCKTNSGQPFFYWLDVGDGKEVDHYECPRLKLSQQFIKYLGPKEREHYEFLVVDGKILHKLTGKPLDTNQRSPGSKWIFVMSTTKRLYAGEKKKGLFHHSSFLAGGATLAAGRLVAEDGVLKSISAYSRYYKPTEDSLDSFLLFFKENGVSLDEVENGIELRSSGGPESLVGCPSSAAMKIQKVYRSYRTRRMLGDSAVVRELWWQAVDFARFYRDFGTRRMSAFSFSTEVEFRWQALNSARLNRGTISFFNFVEPETAASRWNRARLRASKVGKGLSKDAKAFEHWIEAIDPRHRCGRSLHFYYNEWRETNSGQPFFYWLDVGDGKEVDLDECPRSKLCQQFIKYLEPKERAHYEFLVVDGKILHKRTGIPLDTNQRPPGSKWIFVMSTAKRLYTGVEKKGLFHHSSFLAGPRTLAAGKLVAEDGILKSISAYSVHYGPTLDRFLSFLKENGVNLDEVEIEKENGKSTENASISPFCSK